MVPKDGVELNLVFKFSVDGFDYSIFVSSDTAMKCFICGKTGHLVHACPEEQSDLCVSKWLKQDTAKPAGAIYPATTAQPAAEGPGAAALEPIGAAPTLDIVDSGAVLELPALAEAGTGVQGHHSETPVTTLVQEDGENMEMEDESVLKCHIRWKMM